MPSSKKGKDPLCCLVNPLGVCLKCKKEHCGVHSFECPDCGVVCLNCVLKYNCTSCDKEVCDGCAHKEDDYIRCGDCFANTQDTECPCCGGYDYNWDDPPEAPNVP